MPTYKITDNQTGKTVTVTGNTPPTESDAEQIFKDAGLRNGDNKSLFQKTTSKAPLVGAILGGLIGGPFGTGVGTIAGKKVEDVGERGLAAQDLGLVTSALPGGTAMTGEAIGRMFGVKDLTAKQQQEEASQAALAGELAGVADYATLKVLSPVAKAVGGIVKGAVRTVIPEEVSAKTFASAFRLPKKVNSVLEPIKTATELLKHKVSGSFSDMAKIADAVTGENGIISKITREAVANSDAGVETGPVYDALSQASDDAVNINTPLKSRIESSIKSIIEKTTGGKPLSLNNLDALDVVRDLEKKGYGILNKITDITDAMSREQLEQQANMYIQTAQSITDQFDSAVTGINIDKFKTPGVLQALENISPRLKQQFIDAKNLSEVRTIAKPFVRLSKMIDLSLASAEEAITKQGDSAFNLLKVPGQVLRQPETATAIGTLENQISQTAPAQIAQKVGSAVSSTANAVGTPLSRLLVQLGLNSGTQ